GRSEITRDEAIDIFEKWDLKERQSKFIVNSLKVYEYHQLDSYIPMWDFELVRLFQSIPTKFRYKTAMYLDVVALFQKNIIGDVEDANPPRAFIFKMRIYKFAKTTGLYTAWLAVRGAMLRFLPRKYVLSDNMGWYGLFEESKKEGRQKKFYSL